MTSISYDIFISFYSANAILRSEAIAFSRFIEILVSGMVNRRVSILLSSDFSDNPVFRNKEKANIFYAVKTFIVLSTDEYYTHEQSTLEYKLISESVIRRKSDMPCIFLLGTSTGTETNEFSTSPVYRLAFSTAGKLEKNDYYWNTLTNLAYELKQVLDPENDFDNKQQKNIFLAEPDTDQAHVHALIKRELLLNGYNILPIFQLSANPQEFIEQTEAMLRKSIFSIHIFGKEASDYSENPSNRSEVQNRLAVSWAMENDSFRRMIWVDPFMVFDSSEQENRIRRILQSRKFSTNADVLQVPVEEFKNILLSNLHTLFFKERKKEDFTLSDKTVYLLSDSENANAGNFIKEQLQLRNIEFIEISNVIKEQDAIQLHRIILNKTNNIILVANNLKSKWTLGMLSDITKASGYGRTHKYNLLLGVFANTDKALLPVGLPKEFRIVQDSEKELITNVLDIIFQLT